MRRGSLVWRSTGLGIPSRRACPHAVGGWSLSAASDAVGAAFAVGEFGDFGDVVVVGGDYYELGDVGSGFDSLAGCAGVMQADFDLAAISAIYDSGAVTEHQMLLNTGAAAYEQHAHVAFRYGHMNSRVSYTVTTYGNCEVVG